MTLAGAPTRPFLTDEYQPTNNSLWQSVLDVAKGKRRELAIGDRTIHSPNDGQGFYPWPHPNGIAWAVKQYNGFHGGWERKQAGVVALLREGGMLATRDGTFHHTYAEYLQTEKLVRLASESNGWHYWETTFQGQRHFGADAIVQRFKKVMGDG